MDTAQLLNVLRNYPASETENTIRASLLYSIYFGRTLWESQKSKFSSVNSIFCLTFQRKLWFFKDQRISVYSPPPCSQMAANKGGGIQNRGKTPQKSALRGKMAANKGGGDTEGGGGRYTDIPWLHDEVFRNNEIDGLAILESITELLFDCFWFLDGKIKAPPPPKKKGPGKIRNTFFSASRNIMWLIWIC